MTWQEYYRYKVQSAHTGVVGAIVGSKVGIVLGRSLDVGGLLGALDGLILCCCVGELDGRLLGVCDGIEVGSLEGATDGDLVGSELG